MDASPLQQTEDLCQKYAQFASHLDHWHFKILYWTLFIVNLVVLFLGSFIYIKGQESLERYSHDSRRRSKVLLRYILLCFGCVALSAVAVVIEAYALLALQFCDGEDLVSLYWATWTTIQIGALIAIIGIILSLCHALRNRRHPPWALALGTPVLVIAGILHLIHDCTRKRVKKTFGRSASKSVQLGTSMSEVNTIQVNPVEDAEIQGEFIGFTIHGGPIIRFNEASPVHLDFNGEILGYFDGNRPLVAYQKDCIRFISPHDEENQQGNDREQQSDESERERQDQAEPTDESMNRNMEQQV